MNNKELSELSHLSFFIFPVFYNIIYFILKLCFEFENIERSMFFNINSIF